jgi:hypothetical protein
MNGHHILLLFPPHEIIFKVFVSGYQPIVALIVGIVFNNVVTGNESTPANNQNNIWLERTLIVVAGMYTNLKIYQL